MVIKLPIRKNDLTYIRYPKKIANDKKIVASDCPPEVPPPQINPAAPNRPIKSKA